MQIFKLAESSGGFAGLATALGLNLQALILNTLAFFVIVWVMGKWVFPYLIKALDAKRDELEGAARLEREAKANLEKAAAQAEAVVQEARDAAEEILAAAKNDAAAQLEAARVKAAAAAERTVNEAREQLSRDMTAARAALKAETAKLVARATETVLGEKLDAERDAAFIGRSLEGK